MMIHGIQMCLSQSWRNYGARGSSFSSQWHHHDYKGTQVPIGIVEALKDAYKASDPDTALLSLMKDKFIEVQKRSSKSTHVPENS